MPEERVNEEELNWKPCFTCCMKEHCLIYGMQYSCLLEMWEEEKENERETTRVQ